MEALRFTGTGSEYFKIWIVNVLLTIITLGMYYPWAKVRNRRYFYANANLADRNFEYHATGKQLFIGFIIAVGIFIIFQVISQVSPIGAVVLMLLLFLAIPWLVWRSLMFNMRVTSFSNVHFAFKGTLKRAYINFFVYPFLLLLTVYGVPIAAAVLMPRLMVEGGNSEIIGMAIVVAIIIAMVVAFYLFAVIKKKNTEYLIDGSRYGQGEFKTELEAKKFMMINLKTLGISFLVFGVMGALVAMLGGGLEQFAMLSPEAMEDGQIPAGFIGMMATIYLVMIFAMILIMAFGITRQRTYVYDNTKLDNKISFSSTLRARDFAWVMLSNILLVIVTLGFAMPWAKVRMARLMLENTLVDTSSGFNEYLNQKEEEQSSLGEQIGDAFDVDVGVAF